MLSRIQATALIIASASVLCLASDDLKPACDANNIGQLWPEAANHDSKLRKKFSRCGELEVCTLAKHRRYRWESITVRIDQLRGGSYLPKPGDCEVPPESTPEDSQAGSNRASSPTR
jgi:hypothetical protein